MVTLIEPASISDVPRCFGDIYRNKRVLVTGHTGFKGTWLTSWLQLMGAQIYGISLEPETSPNHFGLIDSSGLHSTFCDIRNLDDVHQALNHAKPDIVFHLAAQALVRKSYRYPLDTFSTNVMGTLNVLQASSTTDGVHGVVCVTSDKVYENLESSSGYVEDDRLGGSDPYSCSKACTELLTSCFRSSFLANSSFGKNHHCLVATARAGNVIGGGDWSEDRLIPDAVRGAVQGVPMLVRNPLAVRPWQHVLEPLSGYLLLGQKLLEGQTAFAEAWNFGPTPDGDISVGVVVQEMMKHWSRLKADFATTANGPHETHFLKVLSGKANDRLAWQPTWNWKRAVERTASWYQSYYEENHVSTVGDLKEYLSDAQCSKMSWIEA